MRSGLDAEVGLDQEVLEILQRRIVELALGEEAGDLAGQLRRGAGKAGTQALEPAELGRGYGSLRSFGFRSAVEKPFGGPTPGRYPARAPHQTSLPSPPCFRLFSLADFGLTSRLDGLFERQRQRRRLGKLCPSHLRRPRGNHRSPQPLRASAASISSWACSTPPRPILTSSAARVASTSGVNVADGVLVSEAASRLSGAGSARRLDFRRSHFVRSDRQRVDNGR